MSRSWPAWSCLTLSCCVLWSASPAMAAPVVPPCTISGSGVIAGTPGPDVICGSDGADTITGLGGDDVLVGNGGDDTLDGGPGRNTLVGGAGADLLSATVQNDVFVGGTGFDRVSYATHAAGDDVVAFLADSGVGVGAIGFTERDFSGQPYSDGNGSFSRAEYDRIYDDVEGLIGHAGVDTLVGNIDVNLIEGWGGNDNLQGYGGGDTIRGGSGADGVYGQAGDDALTPDTGNDLAIGGDGADTINAGLEGDGSDDVRGGAGVDLAWYGMRSSPTRASLGNPTEFDDGQVSSATHQPTIERDRLDGIEDALTGSGNDILSGDGQANTLVGNAGQDEIFGGDGLDALQAGSGDDVVHAAADEVRDAVNCGSGVDALLYGPLDLLPGNCEHQIPLDVAP